MHTSSSHTMGRLAVGKKSINFNRRHFLKGAEAALALPLLEAFMDRYASAAEKLPTLAANRNGIPVRLAFLYVPNGVNQQTWFPTGEGRDFQFNQTMTPLEPLKKYIQVFSELDHRNANSNPDAPRDVTTGRGGRQRITPPPGTTDDGGGNYARASGVWLTGTRILHSSTTARAGVSIDQVAAAQIGKLTRIPSLELTCDGFNMTGPGESGYAATYLATISWKDAATPIAPEQNPRALFYRLFGGLKPNAPQDTDIRHGLPLPSLLDLVLEDAGRLNARLGMRDKQVMDQFLTAVREVETRIQRVELEGNDLAGTKPGVPIFEEKIQAMLTLLALAFQTDATRVATCILGHEMSKQVFSWLGVTGIHSAVSRHMNAPDRLAMLAKIDNWYVTQLAAFLKRLDAMKEGDGTSVLENSMIVYGGGMSDGNKQQHHNLPVILAGGGGGSLNPGRYVKLPPTGTPMCNFYLGLLDKLGVKNVNSFGNSTGRLADL